MLQHGHFALGLVAGGLSVLFSFFLLEMFSGVAQITNEYWAALVGALTGGAFSLMILSIEHHNQTIERERVSTEVDLGLAYTLFECLSLITANVESLRSHLAQCVEKDLASGINNLAISVLPVANKLDRTRIPYETKTLLLRKGSTDLYSTIGTLDLAVNAQLDAFERAQKDRERVMQIVTIAEENGQLSLKVDDADEDEFKGRSMVISLHYFEQIEKLGELLNQGLKATHGVTELIKKLGRHDFKWELKQEFIEEFGDDITQW